MNILASVTGIYMFLIFIRLILTWFSGVSYGKPIEILTSLTDPYLNWFRRFPFLRAGFIDLSPIAAMMVLSMVNNVFLTLGRYGGISLGIILAIFLSALWSALSFILGFFIIVLGLRLFAFLTNRNIYGPFWKIVDAISQPVLYRINRIIFRRRLVKYLTGLVISLAALLVLMLVMRFVILRATLLLIRLPL
jgi:YggT family protein